MTLLKKNRRQASKYVINLKNVRVQYGKVKALNIEKLGIECVEKNLALEDILEADEAFYTSTPFCMLPIVRINDYEIKGDVRGPIFMKLISKWSEEVDMDIIEQLLSWSNEELDLKAKVTPYTFPKNK